MRFATSISRPPRARLALVVCALGPLTAAARDFVVTRTDDPAIIGTPVCAATPLGGCSLRQAVLAANQSPGADRIVLGKLTYTLGLTTPSTDGRTGALRVSDPVLVEGMGSALTRVRWAAGVHHQNNVFRFELGLGLAGRLSGLAVSHGRGDEGGCLESYSELHLTDTLVELCEGVTGGGLKLRGTLLLTNTTFRANSASSGGAIQAAGWNTIIANNAAFLDNTASIGGGAVTIRGFPNADGSVMQGTWRNEGKGSRFSGNSATYGGALLVYGNTAVSFYASPATAQRAVFENNVAAEVGGAVRQWGQSLTLENVVLRQNAAASGGAIHADAALVLHDVEFNGNSAQDSSGGALSVPYDPDQAATSIALDRVAFNGNSASQSGGAIASECQHLTLRNVSFHGNAVGSATGRGTAVISSGPTFMAHISSAGHSASKSTFARSFHTYCGAQPFSWANSVIGGNDSCWSQFGGPIASNGGNQFGPGATQCEALGGGIDKRHSDAAVFGLSLGSYGGLMQVLGWTNDGQLRPQVGFGQATYCSARDIRNLPRPAAGCDAGAFEQQ